MSGNTPHYYEDTRYLTKAEIKNWSGSVILKSIEWKDIPVYELYRKDGIRIGKIDIRRGWVAEMLANIDVFDKHEFLTRALCD